MTPERMAALGLRVKPLRWDRGIVDWARPLPGVKYVACSTTPSGSWAAWLEDSDWREVFHSESEAKDGVYAHWRITVLAMIEEIGE